MQNRAFPFTPRGARAHPTISSSIVSPPCSGVTGVLKELQKTTPSASEGCASRIISYLYMHSPPICVLADAGENRVGKPRMLEGESDHCLDRIWILIYVK